MPRIKSSKKRMRQAEARNERNRAQRSQLRNAMKKVRAASSAEDAQKAFVAAESLLARAGRKHMIHPNKAARNMSRLAKAANAKAQASA